MGEATAMEMNLNNPEYVEKLNQPGGIAELAAMQEQGEELPDEEAQEEAEAAIDEAEEAAEAEEESSDDSEEEAEESEEGEPEEEDSEEEEEDENKRDSVKHLRQQVQYEKGQRQKAEAELQAFKQAVMEYAEAQNKAAEGDEEYEPLDERQAEEIKQLKQQMVQGQFQNALQAAEMRAQATYPDFQQAYEHVAVQKQRELMALGATEQQANERAMKFMQSVAFDSFQKGRDIAGTFYTLAQHNGYTAPDSKQTPKGINHKNIAKNRKKTERPKAAAGTVEEMGGDTMKLLQKMAKPGRGVPMEDFKKLLARAQK